MASPLLGTIATGALNVVGLTLQNKSDNKASLAQFNAQLLANEREQAARLDAQKTLIIAGVIAVVGVAVLRRS